MAVSKPAAHSIFGKDSHLLARLRHREMQRRKIAFLGAGISPREPWLQLRLLQLAPPCVLSCLVALFIIVCSASRRRDGHPALMARKLVRLPTAHSPMHAARAHALFVGDMQARARSRASSTARKQQAAWQSVSIPPPPLPTHAEVASMAGRRSRKYTT